MPVNLSKIGLSICNVVKKIYLRLCLAAGYIFPKQCEETRKLLLQFYLYDMKKKIIHIELEPELTPEVELPIEIEEEEINHLRSEILKKTHAQNAYLTIKNLEK